MNLTIVFPHYLLFLTTQRDTFKAGRAATHIKAWQPITKDPEILSYVSGVQVELDSCPIVSHRERNCNASEEELVTVELEMVIAKNVIEKIWF